MYRDRIRVRPASSRLSEGSSYHPLRQQAAHSAELGDGPSIQSEHSYRSEPSWSPANDADVSPSGRGWQYATRVAKLAYETVSTVFGTLRQHQPAEQLEEEVQAQSQRPHPLSMPAARSAALSTPAMPPNTPYYCAAESTAAAPAAANEVERRRPRGFDDGSSDGPSRQVHVRDDRTARPAARVAEAFNAEDDRPGRVYPPAVRGLAPLATQPQNITVNMYFAAPEVNPYPLVTSPEALAPLNNLLAAATRYQPRASLLTVPSAIRSVDHRREKPVRITEAARGTKEPKEFAVKPASAVAGGPTAKGGLLSAALAKATSASEDNSLTMPISMLEKVKPTEPAAKVAMAPVTTTTAPAAPPANPFSFSPKPLEKTAGAPATKTTDATAAPANPFSFTPAKPAAAPANGFVKAGPPAVIPDDDGFASGADSDDEADKGTTKTAKPDTAASAKLPTFSFKANPGTASAPFGSAGATPATQSSAPASSLAFSPTKPAEAAAPPAKQFLFGPPKPAAPTATPPAAAPVNSFVKAGPPAVIPDDSGFAPGADSDDDEKGSAKTAKPDTAASTKLPTFSFKANPGTASAPFGSAGAAPASGSSAPPNPFTLTSTKPAESSAPSASPFGPTPAKPAAPPAAAPVNSFVKAGPPAVIPDDSGFAPGADSDDDEKGSAKAAKPDSAPPAKAPAFAFKPSTGASGASFGTAGATFGSPASNTGAAPVSFGFVPPATTGAPATPFKFSPSPTTGGFSSASPFGASGASSPSSTGVTSSFMFGKPN